MMKKVNILQVDALFSNGIYPIEILFYFKEKLNVKKIRNALKKLSSVFWPIFGEYKDGVISFAKYDEGECYDEEVVEFTIPIDVRRQIKEYGRKFFGNGIMLHKMRLKKNDIEKFRPFDPASGCLVTNISRLPVDKLNFGTGPPDLIFPLTIEKNAAAVLAKDENFLLRFAF